MSLPILKRKNVIATFAFNGNKNTCSFSTTSKLYKTALYSKALNNLNVEIKSYESLKETIISDPIKSLPEKGSSVETVKTPSIDGILEDSCYLRSEQGILNSLKDNYSCVESNKPSLSIESLDIFTDSDVDSSSSIEPFCSSIDSPIELPILCLYNNIEHYFPSFTTCPIELNNFDSAFLILKDFMVLLIDFNYNLLGVSILIIYMLMKLWQLLITL